MDLLSLRADDFHIPLPLANSTAIEDVEDSELNTQFLHDILGISHASLAGNPPDEPILDDDSTLDPTLDPTPDTVLSPLSFLTGRRMGQQCTYNGHTYSHDKTKDNGRSYFQCKDRKLYTP